MTKTRVINVKVEQELYEAVRQKTQESGVPASEVIRRALLLWIETGELPKSPNTAERGKRKTK